MTFRRTLLLVAVAWVAAAGTAHAGEISASGTTITFRAAPGEANFVTVNWGNTSAGADFIPSLSDHYDTVPGAGCQYSVALGARCPSAGPNPTFIVYLGDGNDLGESMNDRAVGHSVTIYGEDGDDQLQSDASSDVLDGGPGNDELRPDDVETGAGDVVRGGPGIDTLQTGNPSATAGPITVAFDDVASDGYPGEADNYASDLENLSAPQSAPPIHFTGNAAPNVVQLRGEAADIVRGLGGNDTIDGANGNDQLDGGEGDDTILGGGGDDVIVGGPGTDSLNGEGSGSGMYVSIAGNDTIDARDGVREALSCGGGADTAIVDALDVVPQDPGSLCEVVDRPLATVAASVRSSKLKLQSRKRVTVSLACPAGVATCTGRLTLKTASKVRVGAKRSVVTLGTAKYSVAAGKSGRVRVSLTAKGRALMRRSKSVRVRITVAPATGTAKTKVVTLRR